MSAHKLPGLYTHRPTFSNVGNYEHNPDDQSHNSSLSPTMPTLELEEDTKRNTAPSVSRKLPPYLELSADVTSIPTGENFESTRDEDDENELVQRSVAKSSNDISSRANNDKKRETHESGTSNVHTVLPKIPDGSRVESCPNQTIRSSKDPPTSRKEVRTEGDDDHRAKFATMLEHVENLSSGVCIA